MTIPQSQLASLVIQGAQGRQGSVGAQGVQGATGAQGTIGAQGVQGTIGAQGAQGAVGSQGVQGATGAQGVQGATGPQGVQGVQGATGAQGDVGAQGVQGATGPQGVQGAVGAQGVQGSIGAQGVQGATGPQGVQGATPAVGGSNTQIQFNNGGALGGSANLVFDGTNVGIGTSSPLVNLDVVNSSASGTGAVTTVRLNHAGTSVGDGPRLLFTSGTSTTGGCAIAGYGTALNAADMLFYAGGNTERMRITNAGNVGIGTSSPNAKLQVTTSSFPVLKVADELGGGAIALGDAAISSNYVGIWRGAVNSISGGGFLNVQGNGIAFMSTDNVFGSATRTMTLDNGGKLLVGTTNSQDAFVNGSTQAVFRAIFSKDNSSTAFDSVISQLAIDNINTTTNNYSQLAFTTSDGANRVVTAGIYAQITARSSANWTTSNLQFYTGTVGGPPTEKMRIDSSGNLLVGSTSVPTGVSQRVLQVTNGTNGIVILGSGATLSPNPRIFGGDTYDLGLAAGVTTGKMVFYTNDAERMRITATGSVLIANGAVGDAYGKLAVFGVTTSTVGPTSAVFSDNITCTIYITHASSVVTLRSDGVLAFGSGSSGTERMRLDTSGNLLIGGTAQTAVGEKFLVQNSATSSSSVSMGIYSGTSGTKDLNFYSDGNSQFFTAARIRVAGGVTYTDEGYMAFWTTSNNGSNVLTTSEKMRISAEGSVSITQAPGKYTIDVTGGATSIGNGGVVDFPSASGMLIVNNWTDGQVTIYLCGGGSTGVVANVAGTQVGSFAYNAGIAGYRWTNNYGSTATFGFFFVRTRNTA